MKIPATTGERGWNPLEYQKYGDNISTEFWKSSDTQLNSTDDFLFGDAFWSNSEIETPGK